MIKKLCDTIVAVSTPKGVGGIGIVRVSGDKAKTIAFYLVQNNKLSRKARFVTFYNKDNVVLDYGLSLFFKKPKSFTGEDLVEFHAHGNDLILDSIVSRIIELGARLATPGEFSFRAFFNGKIDLLQAESINALISSNIASCHNSILKSLSGVFSNEINFILDFLLSIRSDLEAYLAFPDDVSFSFDIFLDNLENLNNIFSVLFNKVYTNYFLSDSLNIVILGDVNVGKSSFFNLLLKKNRSIISNLPGTTRDFIESDVDIAGFRFKLIDTAGLNKHPDSELEKQGILKAYEQLEEASIVILMLEANDNVNLLEDETLNLILNNKKQKLKVFVLHNKIDLKHFKEKIVYHQTYTEIYISVKTKEGVDLFINELKIILSSIKKSSYLVNKRHFDLLLKSKECLSKALYNFKINKTFDLCAEDLNLAYINLSDIIGKNTCDDLINKIFSNFCVGK